MHHLRCISVGSRSLACPACYKRSVGPKDFVVDYGKDVAKFRCSTCRGQTSRWEGSILNVPISSEPSPETCISLHRTLFLVGVAKVSPLDVGLKSLIAQQATALTVSCGKLPWSIYKDPRGNTTREMCSVRINSFTKY